MSKAERRAARAPAVASAVGDDLAGPALDLLALVDMAWHDCYAEIAPPDGVVDDMLLVSRGSLDELVKAALLAVVDWRDLRVAADELRD